MIEALEAEGIENYELNRFVEALEAICDVSFQDPIDPPDEQAHHNH